MLCRERTCSELQEEDVWGQYGCQGRAWEQRQYAAQGVGVRGNRGNSGGVGVRGNRGNSGGKGVGHHHCVTDLSMVRYKRIFAWVLEDAERFVRPLVYDHRQGAVIWTKVWGK